ncbi:two-component response regulator ARR18-like [Solanum dulcamara]|uniref:two-component response regulator ARR18-like n=1 Tax=Solanum dulcamara TaxID=45834 RepID=UPI002486029C|nr:two-component response regulator ARR18-like [Solanum dulcamara]
MALKAMSMLSKGKKNIDAMIINVNSPDAHCFELLVQAAALNIVSLFVCDEHNEVLAKKAFDNGAYLYIKKPLDEVIVKHLWQFVLREKIQREKLIKGQAGKENMPITTEERSNNIHKTEKDGKYKLKRKRDTKSTKEINEGESQSSAINKTVTHKSCIVWNDDLHFKFTEAIEQLGEGRCYPTDILKVMNVPGLTKKQVSSHLQKWRRNSRPQKERRYIHRGSSSGSQQKNSYNTSLERKKRNSCKSFGRMPRLQTNIPNQIHKGPEFPPILNTNNIYASSTQQQFHHSQFQVQPHYLNPFLSVQNAAGSGIQQHNLLFGMLGSENPSFGRTNYRSGLAFNSGDHHNYGMDHHTQNDCSTMTPDVNVGTMIINGLGATNANFQQYTGEQNMFDLNSIIRTSDVNDIEGRDSNALEDCDAYFNFNNMDDLLQNPQSPSAIPPNEHDSDNNIEYPASKNSKLPDE